jgi:hypothetical protein
MQQPIGLIECGGIVALSTIPLGLIEGRSDFGSPRFSKPTEQAKPSHLRAP